MKENKRLVQDRGAWHDCHSNDIDHASHQDLIEEEPACRCTLHIHHCTADLMCWAVDRTEKEGGTSMIHLLSTAHGHRLSVSPAIHVRFWQRTSTVVLPHSSLPPRLAMNSFSLHALCMFLPQEPLITFVAYLPAAFSPSRKRLIMRDASLGSKYSSLAESLMASVFAGRSSLRRRLVISRRHALFARRKALSAPHTPRRTEVYHPGPSLVNRSTAACPRCWDAGTVGRLHFRTDLLRGLLAWAWFANPRSGFC